MQTDSPLKTVLRSSWLAIGAYLGIFVPAMLALAYMWSQHVQTRTDQQDAAQVTHVIAGHVGEVHSLMHALIGMHYATESDGLALIAMAEQMRSVSPLVTAIGRYRSIADTQRPDFESQMGEQGLYGFTITDITDTGSQPAPDRESSLPISIIDPMTPDLLAMLGADLAAHEPLANALEEITRSNRSIVFRLPEGWPASGQLMVFRPAYLGLQVPTIEDERTRQVDGGYWAIIDPKLLTGTTTEALSNFALDLNVRDAVGTHDVFDLSGPTESDLLFSSVLDPFVQKRTFRLGESSLSLSLTSPRGVLPSHAAAVLALLLMSAASLALALAYQHNRRMAAQERERARDALLAEREKAARTLDAIHDAVVTIDEEAHIQHVNPAGARLLGGTNQELVGQQLDGLLSLRHRDYMASVFEPTKLLTTLQDESRMEFDLVPVEETAETMVYRTTLSRTCTGSNVPEGFTLVFRDTSAETRLHLALEHQANHDALTGCTNRHHFERRLEELVSDRRASKVGHALLYMDLDQFKVVNDTAGHSAGDRLLVELTSNLKRVTRPTDVLSRIGGDEFGLIIVDADRREALKVANRVYDLFQNTVFTHDDQAFPVRASLGLVHFSEAGHSTADILAAADMACYEAKEKGRNELFVYRANDETMTMRSTELQWLPRLKDALDRNLFRLHAQPLAALGDNGRITRFEFLLRLADEDGNEITPWQIVQAAERYGLMRELDRWVIGQAIRTVAALDSDETRNMGFAINLSGQSAADPSLIAFIIEQYQLHEVDPTRLCFEITETAAISNFATAVELAKGVQALGSKMALDDFGSGLSSFGYLKNLPVDVLKIDGQFVRDIANNEVDRAMVKAIADVARSMDIVSVAEFVETAASVEVLKTIGIDYAQGFHIGRPEPVNKAIERAIAQNNKRPGSRRAA